MYVTMGKVGSPHGLDGDLLLHYFTNTIEALLDYQQWSIKFEKDTTWKPLVGEEVYQFGNKVLIKFPGVESRNAAIPYVNAQIGVLREDFPGLTDNNEYYWIDLIGLKVYNHSGKYLGTVTSLLETGANDVIVIQENSQKDEILIPFVSEYLLDVNVKDGFINVYWEDDF